jgi:hypothetical protein
MSSYTKELINKFQKLVMKINFEFLENKLFQPIGLELSTVPVIIETHETYTFFGINDSSIGQCCAGKRISAGNFYWCYIEDIAYDIIVSDFSTAFY